MKQRQELAKPALTQEMGWLRLPQEIHEQGIEAVRRARLFIGISMSLIALCTISVLFNPKPLSDFSNLVLLGAAALHATNITLLYMLRTHRPGIFVLLLALTGVICMLFGKTGGLRHGTGAWLAFLPLLAVFFLGLRWGLFFSALAMAMVGVLYLMHLQNHPWIAVAEFGHQPFELALGVAFFVSFATLVAWWYDRSRELAMLALEQTMALNQKLELENQAQKLASAAKSEFLATMSHELRTPLNSILGYAEILEEELPEFEAQVLVPDAQKIQRAGGHLLSLINDILDLSKIEAGKMELSVGSFSLEELLQEIETLALPLAEKNLNAFAIEGVVEMELTSDRQKIKQCLLNLLGNACKFTKDGEVKLSILSQEEQVEFRVLDTGIGMGEEELDGLFEKFSQGSHSSSRKYEGTGLGLAITQSLCELLGGTIRVESQKGVGSTFFMTIPTQLKVSYASQGDLEAVSQSLRDSLEALPAASATVLVIDDDPAVLDMMNRFLSKEGFQVVTSSNGRDGLRIARDLKPFAITLDVMMPVMDGWETLQALKSLPELRDTPVIMMTIDDDAKRGYALGASEFLTKPIDRRALLEVLVKYRPESRPGQVLVVEDDFDSRDLMVKHLRSAGWQVSEADHGAIALERLREVTPDLILLDLMMPELDGFQFLHELRALEEFRAIPVIVVTGKELDHDEQKQLQQSAFGVLQKGGYPKEELLTEVHRLVQAHLPPREP